MKQFLRPGLRVSLFAAVTLCGWALAGADEQALKSGQQFFKDCATDCPEMVVIPAGSFAMGSPDAEPSRKPTEAPRHNVTLAKPFAVSKFEVTFAEWDTCAARGDCTTNVSDHGWTRSATGDQRELGRCAALCGMALEDHWQALSAAH